MKCEVPNLKNNSSHLKNANKTIKTFNGQYSYSGNNTGFAPKNDTYEKADLAKNPVSSLTSLGIMQLISSGLQRLAQFCSYKLSAGKEFADSATVKKIAENMKSRNGLDTAIEYITPDNMVSIGSKYGISGLLDEVARGRNAFFMEARKLAVAPNSKPSLILHELGHAINSKNTLTRLLQNSRRYTKYAPTAILLASQTVPDKKDGKPNFIKKYGGVLSGLAFLPTVIEEALASKRGINAAKDALGKTPALKTLTKNYGFALCTYIIAGLTLGISTQISLKEREPLTRQK